MSSSFEQGAERQAAIDLAREDRLLMSDPFTRSVVENDGKTPDGRDVGDIGEFLASRRSELEKNSPYLSGGKRQVADISPNARGDHPDIWKKGTDK